MQKHTDYLGNHFYLDNCITGSNVIPDDTVDLIITDPPYGIDGANLHRHYNRNEAHVIDGYIDVPAAEYGEFSCAWLRQAERILKPGGQIYIVSGYTHLYHILHALRQTSFREINHIIWKYNFGVYTRKKFISSHYHILYYEKPGSGIFNLYARFGPEERDKNGGSLNYQDREDVWIINKEYKHGRQKNKNELPSQLLMKMLQYSSKPGDLVCDLFMGGFSTARAAIGLNRKFIGFELSENAFNAGLVKITRIIPGDLLPAIRVPELSGRARQGESWTESESVRLITHYKTLLDKKMNKGQIVAELCNEFGRGRFSILNRLKLLIDD